MKDIEKLEEISPYAAHLDSEGLARVEETAESITIIPLECPCGKWSAIHVPGVGVVRLL